MAFELDNLSLEEVSAVDEPANKDARIVLLKRDGIMQHQDDRVGLVKRLAKLLGVSEDEVTKQEEPMADEAIAKQIKELTDQVAELTKAKEAADAKIADLEKTNKELTDRAEKASTFKEFRAKLPKSLHKAFDDMDDEDKQRFMDKFGKAETAEDPVGKALAEVTKANEALAKKLASLEGDAELTKTRAEVADLDGVVKLDEFVPALIALRKADKTAADALLEQTRAVAKQAKEGGLFRVIGKDGPGDDSAEARLEKAVRKYREDNPKATEAQAYDAVLQAQPDLYAATIDEKEAA